MKTRKTLSVLIVVLPVLFLSACYTVGVNKYSTLIRWRTLAEGKIEANERNKPVLVDIFFEGDCPRCEELERDVYSDPVLAEFIQKDFVPVRVYNDEFMTTKEKKLADEMQTGGECILAFLDPDGNIIRDKDGKLIGSMDMITPEQYVEYMDQALQNL